MDCGVTVNKYLETIHYPLHIASLANCIFFCINSLSDAYYYHKNCLGAPPLLTITNLFFSIIDYRLVYHARTINFSRSRGSDHKKNLNKYFIIWMIARSTRMSRKILYRTWASEHSQSQDLIAKLSIFCMIRRRNIKQTEIEVLSKSQSLHFHFKKF